MKRFSYPIIFIFSFACTDQQQTESNESQIIDVSVQADGSEDSESEIPKELIPFRRAEAGGTIHVSEQINENDCWLYSVSHEDVYANENMDTGSVIGKVKKGDKVKVLETLMSLNINDKNIVGNPVKIQLADGTVGYMWNHYLVSMPRPKRTERHNFIDMLWYLNHTLFAYKTDSIIYEGAYYGNERQGYESEWDKTTYHYEKEITYSVTEWYEASEEELTLPHLTITEGFLFLDAWIDDFNLFTTTNGIPLNKHGEFDLDDFEDCYWDAEVVSDEMFTHMSKISFQIGDGCGYWYEVKALDEGVKITVGGGC